MKKSKRCKECHLSQGWTRPDLAEAVFNANYQNFPCEYHRDEEILMKCRYCKKNFTSDEWKKTGNLNGFCSDKCKKKHQKFISPSHLNKVIIKQMNKISKGV